MWNHRLLGVYSKANPEHHCYVYMYQLVSCIVVSTISKSHVIMTLTIRAAATIEPISKILLFCEPEFTK